MNEKYRKIRRRSIQSNNWSIYIYAYCCQRREHKRHTTELAFNYALGSFQSTKRKKKKFFYDFLIARINLVPADQWPRYCSFHSRLAFREHCTTVLWEFRFLQLQIEVFRRNFQVFSTEFLEFRQSFQAFPENFQFFIIIL